MGEQKKPYRPKLRDVTRRPVKAKKPDKEPTEFTKATAEVGAIADRLIKNGKLEGLEHLKRARILYLFTSADKVGKEGMGQAAKYPKKFAAIGRYDFVLTFARPVWIRLTEKQRQALVYHELLHCGSDEKGHWRIEPHDLEEFASVVKHFGIWDSRVRLMAEQMVLWQDQVAGAAVVKPERSLDQAARS